MTTAYYLPFLEVCMYALPHTLRNTKASKGSILKMAITGEVSGQWFVQYNGQEWVRIDPTLNNKPITEIFIEHYAAWKLFSKSLRPKDLTKEITMKGNQQLGEQAVEMVSFMA